ncbi:MAG: hypothetical protein U0835_24740 [Isosphaeraceae bacterium]
MFGLSRGNGSRPAGSVVMEPAWVDPGLGEHVVALEWSPDAKRLAAAAVGGAVVVIDGRSGERLAQPPGHGIGAMALSWSPDGRRLASTGQDGKLRIWDAEDAREVAAVDAGAAWVERVAWCPAGPFIATAAGRKLRLWSPDGEAIRSYADHPSTIADLRWKPGTRTLASAAYGQITLWLPDRDEPVRRFAWKGSMLVIAWSPDGRFIATGNQDSTVHFWEMKTGEDLQMYGYPTKVRELAWDPTGRYLATGGGGDACVWDFSGKGPAGTRPAQLRLTGALVQAVGFRPRAADPLLAAGFADGSVGLWRFGQKVARVDMLQFDEPDSQLAWRPDGKVLAVATAGGGVAGLVDVSSRS